MCVDSVEVAGSGLFGLCVRFGAVFVDFRPVVSQKTECGCVMAPPSSRLSCHTPAVDMHDEWLRHRCLS